MTALKAAIQILQEAGGPLHAKVIAQRIFAKGLWQSVGKTPLATISAQIYSDIKKNGNNSHFVRYGPMTFGLRDASPKDLTSLETYSFSDSAEKVLEQIGNKQPIHYRAITEEALKMGWLSTEGKTPEATMYAQILSEIKRTQKRGEEPRFIQYGKGYVGLSRWKGRGLVFEIEQHNKKVRQALHKSLLAMKPAEFEELIGRLLAEIGFEDIEVTKRTGDGGIDVRGTLVVGEVIRTKMAVQVKKWKTKNRVQAPIVQQVRGSLGAHEQV